MTPAEFQAHRERAQDELRRAADRLRRLAPPEDDREARLSGLVMLIEASQQIHTALGRLRELHAALELSRRPAAFFSASAAPMCGELAPDHQEEHF